MTELTVPVKQWTKYGKYKKLHLSSAGLNHGYYFTWNWLVLDEGLQQLWLQSTEFVNKAYRESIFRVIIVWPTLSCAVLLVRLFCRDYLAFCFCLWTEVGISGESPEHIQDVESPISPQKSLCIDGGEQGYVVTIRLYNNIFLKGQRFAGLS